MIQRDHGRFRKIVKGKLRDDLKKYMKQGEMIGRQGKYGVRIPVPQIEPPKFKFGRKDTGGVSMGPGEVGDPIGAPDKGEGSEGAGDTPGEHLLEVELSFEELAKIMSEALELPNIEPKGKDKITTERHKWTSIAKVGPDSLRHFKRSYKAALKRSIAMGLYDPEDPIVIPEKPDFRYRAGHPKIIQENAAVVINMMDVSGSMGEHQKKIVRHTCWWIDLWLKYQYPRVDIVYIIHDVAAKEVDEHTFYHTTESGGTHISSAYEKAMEIIVERYSPLDWNIYSFHYSDGDNWPSDNDKAIQWLKEELVPVSNQFSYGQVRRTTTMVGPQGFYKEIAGAFGDGAPIALEYIPTMEDIYGAIKGFLGKGR